MSYTCFDCGEKFSYSNYGYYECYNCRNFFAIQDNKTVWYDFANLFIDHKKIAMKGWMSINYTQIYCYETNNIIKLDFFIAPDIINNIISPYPILEKLLKIRAYL